MTAHQSDYGTGSVLKSIVDAAVPLTLAQMLNLLYNIVDRIYIGHIPVVGDVALSGLGLCFPVISLVAAFSMLFGANGGAPLAAMERGAGRQEEAERIMGTAFFMLVAVGLVLTGLGLLLCEPMLYAFGASDVTYPYARDYLNIYLLGSVPVLITLGMNSFINAQGFPRVGMMTVVIGALLNVALDPILIFALDLGVKGAAIATVFSQTVSAVWVLKFLTGRQVELRLKVERMKLEAARLRRLVTLGTSGFVMGVTNSLVQMVCNKMAYQYGGDLYVGVMTVLNSVREVFNTPVMGFSSGAVPVMSYNYGKKAYVRVRLAIRYVTFIGLGLAFSLWIIIVLFPAFFIHLFNSKPQLLEAGVPAMHVYFFGFFMMAFQMSGQNTFVALGKAKHAIFFSLFRKVIIVVPLTLLLPGLWGLGVTGVLLAEPISNFVGGLACYCTMRHVVFPELQEGAQLEEMKKSG
ncbi:MAG: MATE family efflux transporter [Eubacteriales bacterium]|jgi:putative MATE family efflux protein